MEWQTKVRLDSGLERWGKLRGLALLVLVGSLVLGGCTRHYVIKLNNGSQIDAFGRPKLTGSAYHFKDGGGREKTVSAGRVIEVEPASMAKEEKKAKQPMQPKKPKRWYYLWLAGNSVNLLLAGDSVDQV